MEAFAASPTTPLIQASAAGPPLGSGGERALSGHSKARGVRL